MKALVIALSSLITSCAAVILSVAMPRAIQADEICRCCVYKIEVEKQSMSATDVVNDTYVCEHATFCRRYDTCPMPDDQCDAYVCFGSTDMRCDDYFCLPAASPSGLCPETNGLPVGTVNCGGVWPEGEPKTVFCRSQGLSNAVECPSCECVYSTDTSEVIKKDIAIATWEAGGNVSSAKSVFFVCANGACVRTEL